MAYTILGDFLFIAPVCSLRQRERAGVQDARMLLGL